MGHHYKCTSVCMLQDDESTDLHSAAVSHSLIYRYLHRHSMHIIKTKLSIYHVCMYTIPQTGWAVCRYVYTKYITSKVNLLSTAPAIIHSLVTFTVHVSAVMEIALHLPATSMHNHAENLGVHKRL